MLLENALTIKLGNRHCGNRPHDDIFLNFYDYFWIFCLVSPLFQDIFYKVVNNVTYS